VVPKGCGLGKGEASLNLELHEAGSITEALVLALGVNPADQEA
jgi:DNA repair protein RadA/Sms